MYLQGALGNDKTTLTMYLYDASGNDKTTFTMYSQDASGNGKTTFTVYLHRLTVKCYIVIDTIQYSSRRQRHMFVVLINANFF